MPRNAAAIAPRRSLTPNLWVILSLLCSVAAAVAADNTKRVFDLPAGAASETLKQFAAQANREIIFAAEPVAGVKTHAIKGAFTPLEALDRMVANTGLVVVHDEKTGAVMVKPAAKAPPPTPRDPPLDSSATSQRPPDTPQPMTSSKNTTWLAALLSLLAADPLPGQTVVTGAGASPATEAEKIVALSPFIVNTDKDNGYLATSTLAGTRLNSDLKDVGTSISVITAQFLQDTGATDTQGLLTFVTGAEVAGLSGNFLGGSAGNNAAPPSEELRNPQAVTRLRGLASASEARDFYTTAIPADSYNVERFEINRGANAILFGTGSPAGIINASLKRAQMKNTYSFELRTDSYNSFRGSFDFNRQLIKGELALRINGLTRHSKFQQDFAFSNDERLYGAITYDPKWARTKNGVLSGTIIRANIESGNLDSRRPRTLPPSDRISSWFEPLAGGYPAKVTWNAFTGRPPFPTGTQTTLYIFRNASVWFADPNSGSPGTGSTVNGLPIMGRQGVLSNLPAGATYNAGTGIFASAVDISTVALSLSNVADRGFYIRPVMRDSTIFDFRNKLLEGPNRFEYSDFQASNVVLEQLLFKNRAGFELAFNRQDFTSGSSYLQEGSRETELGIDINTTLLDGSINPNFGRPFITGSWANHYTKAKDQTGRATAFYKLDFADVVPHRWAKWLGKLTFTGLHEQGRARGKFLSGDRFTAPDYTFGNNRLITDGNGGKLGQLSYVGPSIATQSTAHGANIPGLTALQLPSAADGKTFQFRAQAAGSPFVTTPLTIVDDGLIPTQLATGARKGGSDSRNQAAIVQSKLLRDSLVVVLGWRRDRVDNYTAAAPSRGTRNNLIVDDAVWTLPATPTTSVSDETQTRSVVFHVPDRIVRRVPVVSGLSLRYNTSENFSPSGSRFNSNGEVIPSPRGTTKDVGFSLGLAGNRVILTATWYTTTQNDITAGGIGALTQQIPEIWRLVKNMEGLGRNPNLSQVQAPSQALLDLYGFRVTNGSAAYVSRNDIVLTQDAVSKGVEFEGTANITRNWRITANASRQSAVRTNSGKVFQELFFVRKTDGKTLFESWTSPEAQQQITDEGGGTLFSATNARILNTFNAVALQDGGAAQELRKWRFNLVTNYSFARGLFKGFGIGSGVRWQDKVAIGFPVVDGPNGIRVPDVRHPFYGPAEFNMDSWLKYERRILKDRVHFTVQVNVFNLLNNDDLIPISTQPDGSIAGYRIPAGRRLELTTRFAF